MLSPVDTKNSPAVAAYVRAVFANLYPNASAQLLGTIFDDIDALFCGRHLSYSANDLRYHDLEHTLQATICLVQILAGRHAAGVEPRLSSRQFELAVCGALLHDTGYLKLRSDIEGTGAKYTFCHVLRSCAFAASYLPARGVNEIEIEAVLGAINCTGPTKQVSRLHFREPIDRLVGCALATADYLGQMAAADYPDELDLLYAEFKESDDFIQLPESRRTFKSADALIQRTPAFWRDWVLPKLDDEFQAAYQFLAKPYPNGRNAYLAAIEQNIVRIQERLTPAVTPRVA